MKRKTIIYGICIFCLLSFFSSCHVGRFFYWNLADTNDHKQFSFVQIEKSESIVKFKESKTNRKFIIPEKYLSTNNTITFDKFLENHKCAAFLVIQNDKIIYENYFQKLSDSTIHPTFSVTKTFISALIGIAINEGYIKSVHQPISDFLPYIDDEDVKKVTIEHLLNMRSGIKFTEGYLNPFSEVAKFYYGRNLKRYVQKLRVVDEPDKKYSYISGNAQILAFILEEATGTKISEYLYKKLWKPLGMENEATWNIDSKKHQNIKAFCCINATARDLAKFGSLYLHKGKWNGKEIIPEEWITRSTSIMNDSKDSRNYPYTYHWRVTENKAFFAKGILGQYIYINPVKNFVIVRLGKGQGNIDWADFSNELSMQL